MNRYWFVVVVLLVSADQMFAVEQPPRSDGRVLHVDFENYVDGVVQPLNAGVRWLGDPFSGRNEGTVEITRGEAFAGKRAAHVATNNADEIARVRLQARYDAPAITGETVLEFLFRAGESTTADGFTIWSAQSSQGRPVGLTLSLSGSEHTFHVHVTHAAQVGAGESRQTENVAELSPGQWAHIVLHRRRDQRVALWMGTPGEEKMIGEFPDLNPTASATRVELGDTSTKTAKGEGWWDDVRIGGVLTSAEKVAPPEPPLRDVSQETNSLEEPLAVGEARQLFLDDAVIASQQNLRREMHAVKKHPRNPLIIPDQPWEGRSVLLYGGVISDAETDRFRMWYLAWGKHVKQPSFVCYADSADGLKWEKPELGLIDFRDSKQNNIVLPGWSQTSVLFDPNDADPQRRYKALLRYNGLRGFTSPDGLHWTDLGVLIEQGYDGTTLHYDPLAQQWVAMVKIFKDGKRARGYATSRDFLHWTDTYFMSSVDDRDAADDEMYAMAMFHYQTVYLGLLRMYHTQSDVVDIQLAVSRNGKRWERPSRKPFIPTGPNEGDWDFGNNSVPATPPIRVGDELWFYYSGRSTRHDEIPNDGAIGLATLRADGFASMTAAEEGTLTTKPLKLTGGKLFLNADASQGGIRVELISDSGVHQSAPLRADGVRQQVVWPDLAELPGEPAQLRFHLKRAKLFSFWVE